MKWLLQVYIATLALLCEITRSARVISHRSVRLCDCEVWIGVAAVWGVSAFYFHYYLESCMLKSIHPALSDETFCFYLVYGDMLCCSEWGGRGRRGDLKTCRVHVLRCGGIMQFSCKGLLFPYKILPLDFCVRQLNVQGHSQSIFGYIEGLHDLV